MCIRGWASLCVTEIRGNCVAGLHIAVWLSLWVSVCLRMGLRHPCVVGIGVGGSM